MSLKNSITTQVIDTDKNEVDMEVSIDDWIDDEVSIVIDEVEYKADVPNIFSFAIDIIKLLRDRMAFRAVVK